MKTKKQVEDKMKYLDEQILEGMKHIEDYPNTKLKQKLIERSIRCSADKRLLDWVLY